MADRLLFPMWPEAVFLISHRDALTPELKAGLRAQGLDLDRKLEPGYAAEKLPGWLELLHAQAYAGQPLADAQRRMGQRFIEGWRETLVGRAVAAVISLVGPRRALLRMERTFRAGDNFSRVEVEELGPRRVRLRYLDAPAPVEFLLGLLEAGAQMTGARNPRWTIESREPPTFVSEWDA